MPETAVHEDGQLLLEESKVGLPGQGLVSAPPGYLVFLEKGQELELRSLVPLPTDGLHDLPASLVEGHRGILSI